MFCHCQYSEQVGRSGVLRLYIDKPNLHAHSRSVIQNTEVRGSQHFKMEISSSNPPYKGLLSFTSDALTFSSCCSSKVISSKFCVTKTSVDPPDAFFAGLLPPLPFCGCFFAVSSFSFPFFPFFPLSSLLVPADYKVAGLPSAEGNAMNLLKKNAQRTSLPPTTA